MEEAGYLLNPDYFARLGERLGPECDAALALLRDVAGPDFNPASTDQVAELVYGRLGLPVTKRTPTGKPSTDEKTLKGLRADKGVVNALPEYRGLSKLINTYCGLPGQADGDGRLRVEFKQLGADTGRFSSESVLQTIPKDDAYGIRNGFVAPEGFLLVAADYRQQELML